MPSAEDLQAMAASRATEGVRRGFDSLNMYVQAGPSGLSLLCFFSGLATVLIGGIGVVTELMAASFILYPFQMVPYSCLLFSSFLSKYQNTFAFATFFRYIFICCSS